jgi:hypothetical protein
MSSRPLVLSEFRKWAFDKRQDRRVFYTQNCKKCPLAIFLQEKRGKRSIVHGIHYYAEIKGSRKRSAHELPLWAKNFVKLVDGETAFVSSRISIKGVRELLKLRKFL